MFKYLAKLLLPHLAPMIEDDLEPILDERVRLIEDQLQTVAFRATDAQLATDTLADELGYTIVIAGNSATIVKAK